MFKKTVTIDQFSMPAACWHSLQSGGTLLQSKAKIRGFIYGRGGDHSRRVTSSKFSWSKMLLLLCREEDLLPFHTG